MKLYTLTVFLVLFSQSLKANEDDQFNLLVIEPKLKNNEITCQEAIELSEEAKKVRANLLKNDLSEKSIEDFWSLVDKLSPQTLFSQ